MAKADHLKIQLVCGFLGAGKTTLLEHLTKNADSKTALLVNEIGSLNIDSELLVKGSGVTVSELPGSCIYCTLERDLVETVKAIVKQAGPEKLLIELIGSASPDTILTALEEAEGLPPLEFLPVIGVIDASNFEGNIYKEEYEKIYWDQISNSDILLLNKMDLVDQEVLNRVEHILRSNSSAVIIPTSYCRVSLPDFLSNHRLKGTKPSNSCVFSGLSYHKVVVNGSFTEESFSQFSERMARGDFGEILRAKGIIKILNRMTVFQYVQGRLSLSPWQGEGKNRLVFIGWNVDGRKLDRDLIPYLKIDLEITDYAGPFGDMRQF